jgi:autotransporter-associated beta strand protein
MLPLRICATVGLSALALAVANTSRADLYWDLNDSAAGASTSPTGSWDAANVWNVNADGTGSPGAWTSAEVAVFSAGGDAIGGYTVTLNTPQNAAGLRFEEGTGTITTSTLTLNSGTIDVASGATAQIDSVLNSTGRITKSGAGTLILNANNNYNGLTINGGMVIIPQETSATSPAGNPLGTAPASATAGYLVFDGGTLRSTRNSTSASFIIPNRGVTLNAGGGTFDVALAGATLSYTGGITGSAGGAFTKTGAGVLTMGINTYDGETFLKEGGFQMGSTATYGNGVGTLHFDGGNVFVSASRTTTLGATNSNPINMSANTTIANTASAASGTRNYTIFTNSVTTTGGTLTLANIATAANTSIIDVRFSGGGFTFSRPVVLNAGISTGSGTTAGSQISFFGTTAAGSVTFSNTISGTGSLRRTSTNDGEGGDTILSGANTYSGYTNLFGGFIGFGSDSTGPAGAPTSGPIGTGTLTISDDSTVGFFAHGAARTVGNRIVFNSVNNTTIKGSNDLTLTGPVDLGTRSRTLTVSNSGVTTFAGVISGGVATLSINKAGPGKLVLNNANAFTGTVQISAGTLALGGNGSINNATTIVGGALGGTGTLNAAVTVQSGASVSPGNSTGILHTGNETWQAGGNYVFEVADASDTSQAAAGAKYDQLQLNQGTGVLDLSGLSTDSKFNIVVRSLTAGQTPGAAANFDPAVGYSWLIASASDILIDDGGVPTSATLANFDPSIFAIDSSGFANAPSTDQFLIGLDGTENALVLTYVPEPGSMLMLLCGSAGLMSRRRRRR